MNWTLDSSQLDIYEMKIPVYVTIILEYSKMYKVKHIVVYKIAHLDKLELEMKANWHKRRMLHLSTKLQTRSKHSQILMFGLHSTNICA